MADRRVLLVTGSSRGIGRYLAEYYAARDIDVIGCSRGPAEPITRTNYRHYAIDITAEADVVRMFSDIRAQLGRLDIVLNNAAINPALALSLLTSSDAANRTLTTNVLGTFMVSREAAKLMMR